MVETWQLHPCCTPVIACNCPRPLHEPLHVHQKHPRMHILTHACIHRHTHTRTAHMHAHAVFQRHSMAGRLVHIHTCTTYAHMPNTCTHTHVHARTRMQGDSNGVMSAGNAACKFGQLAGATAAPASSAHPGISHCSPNSCVALRQSCSLLWGIGCGRSGRVAIL